jgi:hypothetical protein
MKKFLPAPAVRPEWKSLRSGRQADRQPSQLAIVTAAGCQDGSTYAHAYPTSKDRLDSVPKFLSAERYRQPMIIGGSGSGRIGWAGVRSRSSREFCSGSIQQLLCHGEESEHEESMLNECTTTATTVTSSCPPASYSGSRIVLYCIVSYRIVVRSYTDVRIGSLSGPKSTSEQWAAGKPSSR